MSFDHDQKMHDKGYRYKLIPKNANFEPLYAKTLMNIGPLMREYPDTRFDVQPVRFDWNLEDLFHLWRNGHHDSVVRILAEDHPALTALFIAQGIADKHLDRNAVNAVANQLSEWRQAEFQTPA